jgi:hypothetical protein
MAAKAQTEKSKYPSRYSPDGFVTAAQYILELVCEKKARAEGKELPIKFWELKEWRQTFIMQLRKVHSLLKKYDERAIIRAINSRYKLYSILPKWFEQYIVEEQAKLDAEAEMVVPFEAINRDVQKTAANRPKPKSTLDKLKEL